MHYELPSDQWSTRDLPVLRRVAELLEVEKSPTVQYERVSADLRIESDDTRRSFLDLHGAGYVEGERLDRLEMGIRDPRNVIITGLTERGRRELGLWPSPESAVARLTDALDELLTRPGLARDDRSRLEKMRDGLAGLSRDLAVDIGAAIITGRLPI